MTTSFSPLQISLISVFLLFSLSCSPSSPFLLLFRSTGPKMESMQHLSQEQYNNLCARRAAEGRRWISYDQANRQHRRPTSATRHQQQQAAKGAPKAAAGPQPKAQTGQPAPQEAQAAAPQDPVQAKSPTRATTPCSQNQGQEWPSASWVEINSFTHHTNNLSGSRL